MNKTQVIASPQAFHVPHLIFLHISCVGHLQLELLPYYIDPGEGDAKVGYWVELKTVPSSDAGRWDKL
ncbi:hypothetical protein PILCRDRAFT_825809 [Piloderma croceum F 1598]|uniref:Uncharacterized protein n=1 Tax=Piloderma croceum (strain F 1598) TaxID=765440 RepID=A0A0C3EX00_PILCF|nr:hypothetical protein PILCRDRAFT_825809 [Piloderma croceum F 1598]